MTPSASPPATASHLVALTFLLLTVTTTYASPRSSDITANVFGENTENAIGIVAAFGDFNSDELTDIFVLNNDQHTVQILYGADVDPLLRGGPSCTFHDRIITSVVPGDFDGDAYMDLLVTVRSSSSSNNADATSSAANETLDVYIHWGTTDALNCSGDIGGDGEPLLRGLRGEPVALDYNHDMIIDLFGLNATTGERTFWLFGSDRRRGPRAVPMRLPANHDMDALSVPHAHAYLDLNGDFLADLFLTTATHFEVWHGRKGHRDANADATTTPTLADADAVLDPLAPVSMAVVAGLANITGGFEYSHKIELPTGPFNRHVGQSLFLDIELSGQLNQLLPVCFDDACHNSTLLLHAGNHYHDLQVNLKDGANVQWGFVRPKVEHEYLRAITLRGGDFNMDGYPDLLVTLTRTGPAAAAGAASSGGGGFFSKLFGGGGAEKSAGAGGSQPQTFLLENVPCDQQQQNCGPLTRTFAVRWRALAPFTNGTVVGAFYDFYQDGILDVLFVEQRMDVAAPRMVAFRNLLDYDANFVKCIVLTGLTNSREPTRRTALGRKKRTYGTNLPGPRIEYATTTQDGDPQRGTSAQLPQSGYMSLQLPYTIFGLGRTPNFVDRLTVGLAEESRTWNQLIPNSQVIVVPSPLEHPSGWKAQLFVTPSKLIVKSVIALGGTCLVIMLIILALYIKEKREDKVEKLQEAHRFPFDAM